MGIDVAGLGNALVDALVPLGDDALLQKLGLTRGRMHPVDHERWEAVFAQVDTAEVERQTGGSCANTIATLGLLGARAVFCGQVGDDEYGRLYADQLTRSCGGHALAVAPGQHTGKCLSMISRDGERTLVTHLGAAVELPHVGEFKEAIRGAKVLHVTGYLLLGGPMRDAAWEAMEAATEAGIPVSLDVADPFVVEAAGDDIKAALETHASLAFLNEDEATALTGGPAEEAAEKVGVQTTIVKLGVNGSIVRHRGEEVRIGIHPTECIDTTGAGDSYAGGYLYGWVQGWDPARCGDLGARAASLAVGQVGAVCRDVAALEQARHATERGEGT
jgi:sugar/nucleoside kinase (ribokinase family)